jgi:lysophospholipase L1-like esterase
MRLSDKKLAQSELESYRRPEMTPTYLPIRSLTSAVFLSLLAAYAPLQAEIAVKSGEKIAFLGDSITAAGASNPAGYVRLVIAGLAANGVNAEAVPAGISGHKSNQMLARLEKDVLAKKPQWMTLSCGVNDVWHGAKGVPLDDAQAAASAYVTNPNEPEKGTYTKNITAIVESAQASGVKPVVLTATVIKEDLKSPENEKLAPYNAFLRRLAADKKLPLADLNAQFQDKLKARNSEDKKNAFTSDGVHMNAEGNKLMARGVLMAFGLNAGELQKAEASWAPLVAQAEEAAKAAAAAKAAKAAADAAAKAAEAAKAPNGK